MRAECSNRRLRTCAFYLDPSLYRLRTCAFYLHPSLYRSLYRTCAFYLDPSLYRSLYRTCAFYLDPSLYRSLCRRRRLAACQKVSNVSALVCVLNEITMEQAIENLCLLS